MQGIGGAGPTGGGRDDGGLRTGGELGLLSGIGDARPAEGVVEMMLALRREVEHLAKRAKDLEERRASLSG